MDLTGFKTRPSWAVIATNVSGTYEDTDADRSEKDSGYYRGVLNE
jgi:hypothetical protein